MEEVKLNDYFVKVDKEKTLELYKSLPKVSEKAHCGCEDCQLYTKQIQLTSPEILNFFKQLGVDPTKETEVWRAISNKDGYDT